MTPSLGHTFPLGSVTGARQPQRRQTSCVHNKEVTERETVRDSRTDGRTDGASGRRVALVHSPALSRRCQRNKWRRKFAIGIERTDADGAVASPPGNRRTVGRRGRGRQSATDIATPLQGDSAADCIDKTSAGCDKTK